MAGKSGHHSHSRPEFASCSGQTPRCAGAWILAFQLPSFYLRIARPPLRRAFRCRHPPRPDCSGYSALRRPHAALGTTQGVRASIVTRTATNRMANMVRRKPSFIFALHPSQRGPSVAVAATLAQRSRRYCDPAHLQRRASRSPQEFCVWVVGTERGFRANETAERLAESAGRYRRYSHPTPTHTRSLSAAPADSPNRPHSIAELGRLRPTSEANRS